MSIRSMSCGVLLAGAALLGVACNPRARATEPTSPPVERAGGFCGGIAALPCPEGQVCVDDPSDDCDPSRGGADCGGICKKEKKPDCDAPDRTYVSRDPSQCAAIRFFCEPGKAPFFDDCGCGCEPAP